MLSDDDVVRDRVGNPVDKESMKRVHIWRSTTTSPSKGKFVSARSAGEGSTRSEESVRNKNKRMDDVVLEEASGRKEIFFFNGIRSWN